MTHDFGNASLQTWFFPAFEIDTIRFFVVSSVLSDLPKTEFFRVRSDRFWTKKQPNSVTTSDLIGPIFHLIQWQVFLQYWPQSCLVLFRHVGMSSRVVVDGDFNTKTLDKALKNVWKWEWLEKKVWEELIGRFIRKIKTRGHAYCELCNKNINYAGRGYIFL
jgi:hypothetical protein